MPSDNGSTLTSEDLGIGSISPELKESIRTDKDIEARKAQCIASGDRWDSKTNTCILTGPKATGADTGALRPSRTNEQIEIDRNKAEAEGRDFSKADLSPSNKPLVPETFRDKEGNITGVTTTGGNTYFGSRGDIQQIADRANFVSSQPAGTLPTGSSASFIQSQQEAQALQGQIGQFQQFGLGNDSLFDYSQGVTQGLVNAVPRALTGLGSLQLLKGAVIGGGTLVTGTAATAGATGAARLLAGLNPYVAGAALAGTIASSVVSEMKGQRRDTINSQKRVLDEGKQHLNDLATLAATDPSRRAYYVSQYNLQLAQIDQAYRQMRFDVQRDTLKFEKAIPDLAEFEAFYSVGGERDILDQKLRYSLQQQTDPTADMLELAYRKKYL